MHSTTRNAPYVHPRLDSIFDFRMCRTLPIVSVTCTVPRNATITDHQLTATYLCKGHRTHVDRHNTSSLSLSHSLSSYASNKSSDESAYFPTFNRVATAHLYDSEHRSRFTHKTTQPANNIRPLSPTSEMPFEWRFAGWPIVHCILMLTGYTSASIGKLSMSI